MPVDKILKGYIGNTPLLSGKSINKLSSVVERNYYFTLNGSNSQSYTATEPCIVFAIAEIVGYFESGSANISSNGVLLADASVDSYRRFRTYFLDTGQYVSCSVSEVRESGEWCSGKIAIFSVK